MVNENLQPINQQPLVSIVVPIYNVGSFLQPALASVQTQTYRNLEILLIDDGSTDNSGAIADTFANEDQRFIVHHVQNGGLSSARNIGITHATGEFIYFFDSDDIMNQTLISKAVKMALKENVAAVIFDYEQIDENGCIIPSGYGHGDIYHNTETLTNHEALKALFKQDIIITAWSYLVKRDVLIDNQVKFTVGRLHEDMNTTPRVLWYAKNIGVLDERLYQYRIRSGSIMKDLKPKNLIDSVWMLKQIETFLQQNKLYNAHKNDFAWLVHQTLLPYVFNISDKFLHQNPATKKDYFGLLEDAYHEIKIDNRTMRKLKLSKIPGISGLKRWLKGQSCIF
ncbi:glycosyltransferase [Periweissella fabalis]|uniref:Glycosyltransferase n=1 Tax=Periweissella fabalis TaxID=1070421 RepID=A0A7X6S4A0_9LACO|nr:glycosyltransferase [Periweissella fabalis]MCM0598109.1 glycosyltransferase [Periweissella fabalis]NKZ24767.1 glycosyltransferase [Periweissella fabalis]